MEIKRPDVLRSDTMHELYTKFDNAKRQNEKCWMRIVKNEVQGDAGNQVRQSEDTAVENTDVGVRFLFFSSGLFLLDRAK